MVQYVQGRRSAASTSPAGALVLQPAVEPAAGPSQQQGPAAEALQQQASATEQQHQQQQQAGARTRRRMSVVGSELRGLEDACEGGWHVFVTKVRVPSQVEVLQVQSTAATFRATH